MSAADALSDALADHAPEPVRVVVQLDSATPDHQRTALLLASHWGELTELDLSLLRLMCVRRSEQESDR